MEPEERPPDPQARSIRREPAAATAPQDPARQGPRRADRRLPLIALLVLATCVPVGAWLLRDRGEQATSSGAVEAERAVAPQTYPAGTQAPPLRLPALDGGAVDLARFRGRPVLVNFWATWCAPCVREFPLLRRTLDQHRADGLVVLGVLVNDSPDKARAFVREHGGTWPVGVDRGGRAVAALKLVGLPESVFVRRDGTLSSRVLGELTPAQLQAQLAPILR